MKIKLSKEEVKTLKALDPKAKGAKPWQSARQVAAGVFKKKVENLDQEQIRVVRNSFRKIVREKMVEMNPNARGEYRVTEKGRKLLTSGETEVKGVFERGLATRRGKESGKARKKVAKKAPAKKKAKVKAKAAPKKQTKKAAKKKKVTKKDGMDRMVAASKKKSAAKKSAKKAPKKKASAKKAAIKVEDKSKATTAKAASKNGNGKADGARKGPPSFKRRKAAATYNPPAGN